MQKVRDLIIFGSGGHALVLFELAQLLGFKTRFFIDSYSNEEAYLGLPVHTSTEGLVLQGVSFGLGVGANFHRESLYLSLKSANPDADFPALVHPSAYVSRTSQLGEGTVVLAQANIGPLTAIGIGSLINSSASLDHESRMGSFSSLGPGAVTGGNVEVGKRAVVGLGAAVLQGTSIGADTVIGAASMVRHDVPANSVAFGTPSQVIRTRKIDDPYL